MVPEQAEHKDAPNATEVRRMTCSRRLPLFKTTIREVF